MSVHLQFTLKPTVCQQILHELTHDFEIKGKDPKNVLVPNFLSSGTLSLKTQVELHRAVDSGLVLMVSVQLVNLFFLQDLRYLLLCLIFSPHN